MLANRITTLITGVVFGLGLGISGMINPSKVLNFLDFAGNFDATLLIVFAAGVAVAAIGYYVTFKRKAPFFAEKFRVSTSHVIDKRLIGGAALFGIGWGLTGYCPGPAMGSLAYLQPISLVFLAAMAVGSYAAKFVPEK